MVLVPHLVVANSDRQYHALYRGCDRISRSACGRSISDGIFATRPPRSRSSLLGLEHSALARQIISARVRLGGFAIRDALRSPTQIRCSPIGCTRPHMIAVQFILLTVAWTHACIGLYFWLRLKPFFRWAAPHPARHRRAAAAARDDRRPSGRARGHRARQEAAMARAEFAEPMPPPQARGDRRHHAVLFSDRLRAPRSCWCSRRAACARCASAGAACSRCRIPNRQVRVPKGMSVLEASLRLQNPARQRLRRPRPLLDLPRSRRQRPQRLAAAVRTRGLRAGARRRQRRSLDPSGLPAAAADRRRRSSRCCRRTSAPTSCASRQRINIGEERYIVSMFVDMRGSTTLAEGAAAIRHRLPDQPVCRGGFAGGDSTPAASRTSSSATACSRLFGLDVDPATACRQALRAAVAGRVERRPT